MSTQGASADDSDLLTLGAAPHRVGGEDGKGLPVRTDTQQHMNTEEITQGDRLVRRPTDTLRVMSINIQGDMDSKVEHLCEWMSRYSVDMLCIQEHNCKLRTLKGIHYSLRGRFGLYGTGTDGNRQCGGVAVLVDKTWVPALQKVTMSADSRVIALDFLTRSCHPVRLVNVYGPSDHRGERKTILDAYTEGLETLLSSFRDEHPDGRLMVMGDFNMVERPEVDRDITEEEIRTRRPQTAYEQGIIELLRETHVVDVFRKRHGELRSYTHSQATQRGQSRARLDRIYADDSPGLTAVMHVTTYDQPTDHCPVMADFRHSAYLRDAKQRYSKPTPRLQRPGLSGVNVNDPRWEAFTSNTNWTDRAEALEGLDYAERLDAVTTMMFEQALSLFPAERPEPISPSEEDLLLKEIHFEVSLLRRATRIYTHDWKEATTKQAMKRVCRQIRDRGQLHPTVTPNGLSEADFRAISDRLTEKREELRRGLCKRKRKRLAELDTQRLSLFTPNQLGAWYRKTTLKRKDAIDSSAICMDIDGRKTFTSESKEVLAGARKLYYDISAAPNFVPGGEALAWARDTYAPAPMVASLLRVMEPVQIHELEQAISRLPHDKAAGPDGVKAELYMHAHPSIRQVLCDGFNEILAGADPPASWAHGHVFPVPKSGGLPTLDNSRPISLLSVQRKLFERIINDRLTTVMEEEQILHEDQHGFTRGKSTMTPITVLNAVLEHARDTKKPLYGVLFDVSKAFDTVPTDGLELSMARLGFPASLRRLLTSLNGNSTAQVITKYGLTEKYDVERGVRQGSILSPLLWKIFMDPVLRQWKTQRDPYSLDDGHGTRLPLFGQAYADDALGLASSPKGLLERIRTMDLFCEYHGLKLNKDKSEVFTNEAVDAHSPIRRMKLLRSDEAFRYLGIWFTVTLNWKPQEAKLAERLSGLASELRAKRLTYFEAAVLYKSIIVPTVAYVVTVAGVSDLFLKRWDATFGRILLNKLKIGQGTNRGVLYGGERSVGLRLPALADTRRVHHINEMIHGLNSKGTISAVLRSAVARTQFEWGMHEFPLALPAPAGLRHSTYATRVWAYLREWALEIAAPEWKFSFKPREDDPASQLLRNILPKDTPQDIWRELAEAEKFFLSDVLDRNRAFIADATVRRKTPAWYRWILKWCTIPHRGRRVQPHLLLPQPAYVPPFVRERRTSLPPPAFPAGSYTAATDGALIPGDEKAGRAATAACIFVGNVLRHQVARRIPHAHLSSTDVELMALNTALAATPPNCPLVVYTDAKSIADRLRNPEPVSTTRQAVNMQARPIWRSARRLLRERTAATEFTFVKAHTRDGHEAAADMDTPAAQNKAADNLARQTMRESQLETARHILEGEMEFSLVVSGLPWIHKPSTALWRTVRAIHDEHLFSRRRQGFTARTYLSAPTHPTADTSRFREMLTPKWTGKPFSFLRKLWLGVLPSKSVMSLRDRAEIGPDNELDDKCPFCDDGSRETNIHVMVSCPRWRYVRSDLLHRLGDAIHAILGAELSRRLQRPVEQRELLEVSGILDSPDIWFGLFPKRFSDALYDILGQKLAPRSLRKLFELWNVSTLPLLWRERCRCVKEPEAGDYAREFEALLEMKDTEANARDLELECVEDNSAAQSLTAFLSEGLADVASEVGPGRRRVFLTVRESFRMALARPFESIYVPHDRWTMLASSSIAETGRDGWTLSRFRDLLAAAWSRQVLRTQNKPYGRKRTRPELPRELHALMCTTLRTRVELFCSPFSCHLGYTAWFTAEQEDERLGFYTNGTSHKAISLTRGHSALCHPPSDRTSLRRAVLFAGRAIRTDLPTRVTLIVPSTGTTRADLGARIRAEGGVLFLRIPAGSLPLPEPPSMSLEVRVHHPLRCDVPTDIFLFENAAASRMWRPPPTLRRSWRTWIKSTGLQRKNGRRPRISPLRQWDPD